MAFIGIPMHGNKHERSLLPKRPHPPRTPQTRLLLMEWKDEESEIEVVPTTHVMNAQYT